MTLDKRIPIKNPNVRVRDEEFGKLLLSSGLPLLCINKDAERIWDLCDGKNNISEIIKICAESLDDFEAASAGVHDFIDEAIRLKLVAVEA